MTVSVSLVFLAGQLDDDGRSVFSDYRASIRLRASDRQRKVTRWLGPQPRRPVASLAQMQQVLDRRIVGAREQPNYGLPAVELRATGQVVGAVLLSPLPGDDTAAEIGWHLNPDYWGAGYAT
jgi:RimJ/RimL family protein N-acetyltransferase